MRQTLQHRICTSVLTHHKVLRSCRRPQAITSLSSYRQSFTVESSQWMTEALQPQRINPSSCCFTLVAWAIINPDQILQPLLNIARLWVQLEPHFLITRNASVLQCSRPTNFQIGSLSISGGKYSQTIYFLRFSTQQSFLAV